MALKVGKIGHASLVVSTDEVTCFVDPVLVEPFASSTNVRNPPVTIDLEAAREACEVIVLSHAHPDHFSPRSLAGLDRECIALYPAGCHHTERALQRLGFANARPMVMNEKLTIADLDIYPTASRVAFPENGLLFRAGGKTLWDCVDTVITEETIALVRSWVGTVDVMLAAWQPLNQGFSDFNGLNAAIRYDEYSRHLRTVFETEPRYVVPASCGFSYTLPWLNDLGFPLTEAQFIDDLRAVMPDLRASSLPAGGVLSVEDLAIDPDGLSFVRRLTESGSPAYDWRPEHGIPPLTDPNPHGHEPAALPGEVATVLDELLVLMSAPEQAEWRSTLARLNVVWCLDLVYPDGSVEARSIGFREEPLRWSGPTTSFAKMRTAIAASALVGLVRGELDWHAALCMCRVTSRLYFVSRSGAAPSDVRGDEPIGRFLRGKSGQATDRMLEYELRALGV